MKIYRKHEMDTFLDMHKYILNDDGEATLSKRGVLKPGSSTILRQKEIQKLLKKLKATEPQTSEQESSEDRDSVSLEDPSGQ